MATAVAMATITTYTVHVEISVVCKFHGHLHVQQKFNPWKFASLQQLEIATVHSMWVTSTQNDYVYT